MTILSSEELTRYNRQIIMADIGEKGQELLKKARVFIAGVGGLGSVISYYMTSTGIGFIRIVDKDRVALENLNRQIIHRTGDIGIPKIESAANKLRDLNPNCQIDPLFVEIREDNISDMVKDCMVIVDATDNVKTRRILNRASIKHRIPFVCGGAGGFNGMATTFVPGETPCFECLFPQRPIQESVSGVVGPAPGIVASIQCLETIKLIIGMKPSLKGQLLYIFGCDMSFKMIEIEKDPCCKMCGVIEKECHDS